MKTVTSLLLTAALAFSLVGCGAPPANNANTNTNTNTARNTPAAPTADALLALDKQANEAYSKGDSKFFETFLSDKFMMRGMKGKPAGKADMVKMVGEVKCDVKSFDISEPQMAKIDNDTYVLVAKTTWDGTCTENGKSMKIPSPARTASVYVRSGDKWLGGWHGETMIMEPKGDADDKKVADDKKATDTDKKAEVKKDEPKKEDTAKKEEPKKEEARKPADNKAADPSGAAKPATSGDAAPAAPATADANTEALTKLHQAGWEAWREKDAAKLTAMTAANLSFVDPEGKWFGTKDAVIKEWTGDECKDVKTVKVADGFAFALSPTVEVFMHTGTADGTCGGMKNGKLDGTAIYVKEGSDWKLAFLFESPAM